MLLGSAVRPCEATESPLLVTLSVFCVSDSLKIRMAVHTVVRSNFKVDFGDGIPLDVGDEGKQSVLPDIKSQISVVAPEIRQADFHHCLSRRPLDGGTDDCAAQNAQNSQPD